MANVGRNAYMLLTSRQGICEYLFPGVRIMSSKRPDFPGNLAPWGYMG